MNTEPSNRVYLHIGMDKCGTSYLQETLRLNRKSLEHHGITYLPVGRMGIKYRSSMLQLHDPKQMEEWHRVAARINQVNGTVLFSYEGLYHLTTDKWRIVRQLLAPRELHIILYLRHQSDMMASGLAQRIKNSTSKYDYRFHVEEETGYFSSLSFQNLLGRFKEFPDSSIHLRLYEKSSFYRNNLVSDFLDILNLDADIPGNEGFTRRPSIANPTLDVEGIHIMSELKRTGAKDHQLKTARSYLTEHSLLDGHTFIPQRVLNLVADHVEADNQAVAQRWFNRTRLFLDPPRYSWRPLDITRLGKLYDDLEQFLSQSAE